MANKLIEGKVDISKGHIRISYEDYSGIVAVVAPGEDNSFIYEFGNKTFTSKNIPEKVVSAVMDELEFYLIDKREDNPWGYAIYHCSTASNMYSDVHWHYYPEGWE